MTQNDGQYAWMIERRAEIGNESSAPLWWDSCKFSPDPNQGIRFARKEDADKVIAAMGFMHTIATDHKWFDSQSPE